MPENDLQRAQLDFESEADEVIDRYFAEKGVQKDVLELWEKKMIVKELALAQKRSEIIEKLNSKRRELSLPEIQDGFDIFYYQKEYAPLVEDISLHYAANLSKKFRFANRITRIAKLNDIAEGVLTRVRARENRVLQSKEESLHNDNIKLLSQLMSAIDEQMGKIKLTRIDVNVRKDSEKLTLENPQAMRDMVGEALKRYVGQLPASVDANFNDVTDYEKCVFGEEWTSQTHCQYFNEQCKVQTDEIKTCPHFCNKVLLNNRDYMTRRFINDKLSSRQIAEIAGCKEVDDRVLDHVKRKLREFGIERNPGGTDKQ